MLKKRIVIPLMAFAVCLAIVLVETSTACTIGVASGRATASGRPMIWKSRDSGNKNNEVTYSSRWYKYKFIAVTNADDTRTWQGVNEKGLCILNSVSSDLGKLVEYPSDNENGAYMRKALGYCATVNEFEELLKNTNFPGRETMANYAVMDATGAVAIFETASKKYWKFDAPPAKNTGSSTLPTQKSPQMATSSAQILPSVQTTTETQAEKKVSTVIKERQI